MRSCSLDSGRPSRFSRACSCTSRILPPGPSGRISRTVIRMWACTFRSSPPRAGAWIAQSAAQPYSRTSSPAKLRTSSMFRPSPSSPGRASSNSCAVCESLRLSAASAAFHSDWRSMAHGGAAPSGSSMPQARMPRLLL